MFLYLMYLTLECAWWAQRLSYWLKILAHGTHQIYVLVYIMKSKELKGKIIKEGGRPTV